MKVIFFKAKHIWKDGKSATWIKSDKFGEKIFSQLKKKYESIKYSRDNYIVIDGMILFLFYQNKKDFHGRPITEITALLPDKRIKNPEMLFDHINDTVPDIFDDVLEYDIEIDDKYIVRDQLTKYLVILSVLLLCAIGLWIYIDGGDAQVGKRLPIEMSNGNISSQQNEAGKNKPVDKIAKHKSDDNPSAKKSPPETTGTVHIGKKEPKKVLLIVNKEKKKWKWERFCKRNNIFKTPQICYQMYIQQKCKEKSKFTESYLEYAKNHMGKGSCEEWKKLSDDSDLKVSNLKIEFFKGDKINGK